MRRIAEDCNKGLYSVVHINFASPVPRALLEEFAKSTVHGGGRALSQSLQPISELCVLEPLFSLNMPNASPRTLRQPRKAR